MNHIIFTLFILAWQSAGSTDGSAAPQRVRASPAPRTVSVSHTPDFKKGTCRETGQQWTRGRCELQPCSQARPPQRCGQNGALLELEVEDQRIHRPRGQWFQEFHRPQLDGLAVFFLRPLLPSLLLPTAVRDGAARTTSGHQRPSPNRKT